VKIPRPEEPEPDRSPQAPETFVRLLMGGYYPFIILVLLFQLALTAGMVYVILHYRAVHHVAGVPRFLVLLLLLILLPLLHLLWALRLLFVPLKDVKDEMEVRVPRDRAPRLYEWVEAIAEQGGLPAPDEIRVAADTVAHVYERLNGKNVLVFGAIAVRAFPQPVLAGIVAHELGHVAAGDTALLRQARRRHMIMEQLELAFLMNPDAVRRSYTDPRYRNAAWQTWAALLNPAVWAVRLYHWVYFIAHAALSRQCEYAADRHEVRQSGADSAARALVLLAVAERMPWTRLSSMAESWVQTNQPARQLFESQARAARSIPPGDWQDALRLELKKPTGVFDSHPGLMDRLAAIGVSPKKAKLLTPEMSGPPSDELFDGQWPKLETQLAERLLVPFRDVHLAKMEVGEVVSALDGLARRRGGH
jgi:Zn-dependent protease with chaperone function